MAPHRQHRDRTDERWSQRVTRESSALELEPDVFTWGDPLAIARSLQAAAEKGRRRRTTPFRTAMSMLTFYINRAGTRLDDAQRAVLEQAKDELRRLYRYTPKGAGKAPR